MNYWVLIPLLRKGSFCGKTTRKGRRGGEERGGEGRGRWEKGKMKILGVWVTTGSAQTLRAFFLPLPMPLPENKGASREERGFQYRQNLYFAKDS